MTKVQCSGITVKKQRCKIRVSDGNYCSHHLKQDPKYQDVGYSKYQAGASNSNEVFNMNNNNYSNINFYSATKITWDYVVTVKKEQQKEFFSRQLGKATSLQGNADGICAKEMYKSQEAKGNSDKASPNTIYGTSHYKNFSNGNTTCTGEIKIKLEETEIQLNTKEFSERSKKTNPAYNFGSIYIYTYKHLSLESPAKKDWINIRSYQLKDMEVFNPKYFMLIKVGYTKQPVKKRLKQWNDQCEHDIILIDLEFLRKTLPPSLNILINKPTKYERYISKTEKNNSFSEKDEKKLTSRVENFMTRTKSKVILKNEKLNAFQDGEGFHCKSDAAIIEKKIHKFLGKKYGRILMNCENCSAKNEKGRSVHTEWFLIPKLQLVNVFYAIDKFCSEYPIKQEIGLKL